MNKVEKIKAEIERRKKTWNHQDPQYVAGGKDVCDYLLGFIDSLEEEPISNGLEEASRNYAGNEECGYNVYFTIKAAFKAGAQWQKEQDQSTIELAKDHAYLAGQEKIIEKACEWLNNFYSEDRHCYFVEEDIDNFKKAMEG